MIRNFDDSKPCVIGRPMASCGFFVEHEAAAMDCITCDDEVSLKMATCGYMMQCCWFDRVSFFGK
jgi:hypothetical protein